MLGRALRIYCRCGSRDDVVAKGAARPALLITVLTQQQNANADNRNVFRAHLQSYIGDLVSYAEELVGAWEHRPAAQLTTEFGVSLAIDVVHTLRGLSESGRLVENPQGGEPLWRKLKWGMTIAARALDVYAAPEIDKEDLVSNSAGAGCHCGALLRLEYERACRRAREVALFCAIHTRRGYEPRRLHGSRKHLATTACSSRVWKYDFRGCIQVGRPFPEPCFEFVPWNRRVGTDASSKIQTGACGRSVGI